MLILTIRSPFEELREIPLAAEKTTIGRVSENDILIPDEVASRFHAEIYYHKEDQTLEIKDLDSTNGTFLNGKKIQGSHPLNIDDNIRIGSFIISIVSNFTKNGESRRSTVPAGARELLIESVENNAAVLLDFISKLNNIPDLKSAYSEVTSFIQQMTGANACKIVTDVKCDHLEEQGILPPICQQTVKENIPKIISDISIQPSSSGSSSSGTAYSTLCVPVSTNDVVEALIVAEKKHPINKSFEENDLKITVAVAHQLALTIQRKRNENRLLFNANHDPLTGLPNSGLFIEELKRAISQAKEQEDYKFAIIFFDIDDFKVVNDTLGHTIGDELLVAVVNRLKKELGDEKIGDQISIFARLGGDEFGILMDNIKDMQTIHQIAEIIKDKLSTPFSLSVKQVLTSASIGVALSTMDYDNPKNMLRDADIAMYRAKGLGKARYEIFDKQMDAEIKKNLELQKSLRQAIDRKQFHLYYQPIISLQSGKIAGFEALLRWELPGQGLLCPDKFLRVSDTTGLLSTIDYWVMQKACAQIIRWQEKFPAKPRLFMSVNLSGKQIKHPNLIGQIEQALQDSRLDPRCLWLEITESVSIENSPATLQMLSDLRAKNINISLDDFGMGFSSLSYLHRFPVSALKIDRSFVSRIEKGKEGPEIIQTIVNLAKQLSMTVIAEGIENSRQLAYLRSLNCEFAQGFYFSEALGAEEMTRLISQQPKW